VVELKERREGQLMKGGIDIVAHSSILRVVPSGPKIGQMDDERLAVAVVGGSPRARVPRQ